MKRMGVTVILALLTVAVPSSVWALDNEQELSFLLFHAQYRVSQTYLNNWSGNPTPDQRHAGIDFATPSGTTVYAPMSGTVIRAGGRLGYCSLYNATLNRTVIFLHMSTVNFEVDDEVRIGEILGATGKEGADSPHCHVECRPGRSPYAVGPTSGTSTAALTINPLAAFADVSSEGLSVYESVMLDANAGGRYYEIFYCEYFHPGEVTLIVKGQGTLDADVWYWDWWDQAWYPLSTADGNEFRNWTFGSGYSSEYYPLYIAVVAYSGSGAAQVMWHATQSAE